MNNIDNLETKKSRFIFFGLIFLFVITLYIISILVNNHPWKLVLDNVILTIASSLLVSTVISMFILWVAPKKVLNARVEILQPYEINSCHLESRKKTTQWWYNGGSGRYTRNVTLPSLAKSCRDENCSIDVRIQILNPENQNLCKLYADYRNGLKSSKGEKRTTEDVQYDLLSTIICAYYWKEVQTNLNVIMYLKNHFSPFRMELSDNLILITREDPLDPAIVYRKDSFYYAAYRNDLDHGCKQCSRIDFNINYDINEGNLTANDIKQILIRLKIFSTISDEESKKVLDKFNDKTTPYTK